MRASPSFQFYTLFLLFLSTFTAAWPWPKFMPDLDSLIMRRQNTNSDTSNSITAGTASNTGSVSPIATPTDNSASGSITPAPTSGSASPSGSSTKKPTATVKQHTDYDPVNPAGGISMLTPAVSSGAQYYRIGDYVTFGWNYTSLLATPTAVDIVASCSANKQLYTLAMNQTVTNATGGVTWDTNAYQTGHPTIPLLTETYTLIIYDADSSISAPAEAGYLAPFNQYTFGLYAPQAYTPLNQGFQCVTCSGAFSDMERKALGFMLGMSTITVLSFSWFVGGLDIVW